MIIFDICKKIKAHRKEQGLTQKELANSLFMDERNYAKIERGQKKTLDVILLLSIAEALEVDIVKLIKNNESILKEQNKITEISSSISDEMTNFNFQLNEKIDIVLNEQIKLRELISSIQLQMKISK